MTVMAKLNQQVYKLYKHIWRRSFSFAEAICLAKWLLLVNQATALKKIEKNYLFFWSNLFAQMTFAGQSGNNFEKNRKNYLFFWSNLFGQMTFAGQSGKQIRKK